VKYKILAVDDEPDICWVIAQFLTDCGYNVLTTNRGEDALAMIDKEKPDLLILDKKMPGIGGAGVLKELARKNINMPVIMLTGSVGTPESISDMDIPGHCDYLTKPVSLSELKKVISRQLDPKDSG
jgi:DNA-binding NtrC family response regulator